MEPRLSVFGAPDQFSHLRPCCNRFNDHNVGHVENHTIGRMRLFPVFDEHHGRLFGVRIGLMLNLVHVCEHRRCRARPLQLAVGHLAIG
jgi:hypothetical protein